MTTGLQPTVRGARSSAPWLAAAAGLFAAYLALHLPITDFFDGLARTYGFPRYNNTTRLVFTAIGAAALAAAWAWPGRNRRRVGAAATFLVAAAAAAQRLLIVVAIEAVHYPQYAIMAGVLAVGGATLEGAWFGAVGLGCLDELFEYLVLPRGTPTYFDWNDVVLNAIGAAFGCVFVVAVRQSDADVRLFRRGWAGALAGIAAAAALVRVPMAPPFMSTTPGGQRFLQLTAAGAVLPLLGLWWFVRALSSSAADRQRNLEAGAAVGRRAG